MSIGADFYRALLVVSCFRQDLIPVSREDQGEEKPLSDARMAQPPHGWILSHKELQR